MREKLIKMGFVFIILFNLVIKNIDRMVKFELNL